jgi:hypothetical protein
VHAHIHLQDSLNRAVGLACDLLSTPSLLAGSFTSPSGPLHVDVEGVEACYIALMQMGKVRLLPAVPSSYPIHFRALISFPLFLIANELFLLLLAIKICPHAHLAC